MKRSVIVFIVLLSAVAYAQRGAAPAGGAPAPAPQAQPPAAPPAGGGRGGNPQQDALEKATPQIPYEAVALPLMPTGNTIGETVGVAINSKKHLFVFTRTGNIGPAKGATAAKLFEFDQNNKYVREWGENMYGASFAHVVRVDKDDNVWVVDEGSNMVIKFNPQGLVTLVLGRKAEAIDYIEEHERDLELLTAAARGTPPEAGRGRGGAGAGRGGAAATCGGGGSFGRPTDVTWDTQGNIFVADGYTNSRTAKFTKDGAYVGCVGASGRGSQGNQPLQFSTPHTIASDAKGNIYVGDRGNSRIQVLDPDLKLLRIINTVRSPWGMCITPPNASGQQFIYSADAGGKVFKTDLDGKLLGWFGSMGKQVGQFHWVHSMHCESENVIYTGEAQNWRIQKITMKAGGAKASSN